MAQFISGNLMAKIKHHQVPNQRNDGRGLGQRRYACLNVMGINTNQSWTAIKTRTGFQSMRPRHSRESGIPRLRFCWPPHMMWHLNVDGKAPMQI
jgi:hypothetical protein